MSIADSAWDFFIAHAGPDKDAAELLYEYLATDSRPFLDSKCLPLGDDWNATLPRAQRNSRVTVVLVSPNTTAAYYQREEVAAAIDLARLTEHRVVPVYLPGTNRQAEDIPYGLRLKQGVSVGVESELKAVAQKLLNLIKTDASALSPQSQRAAVERDRPGSVAKHATPAARLDVIEGAVRLHLRERDPSKPNSVFRVEVTIALSTGRADTMLIGVDSTYLADRRPCLHLEQFLDIRGERQVFRDDNVRLRSPIPLSKNSVVYLDYIRLMQPPTQAMWADECEYGRLKVRAIIGVGSPPRELEVESGTYEYRGARSWSIVDDPG